MADDGNATVREGVRRGWPFAAPTVAMGITFGVLAGSLGWGALAPIVASALVFSASGQFAIATVLGSGGGAAASMLAVGLNNARFLPMSIAVAPALKGRRWRRALEAQAVNDASWALANRGGGRFERTWLIGATVPQYVAWVGGTVLGVVGASVVDDPRALGLDVVFPAFFLSALIGELRDRRTALVAASAVAIVLVTVPLAPVGVPVLAACAAALLALR